MAIPELALLFLDLGQRLPGLSITFCKSPVANYKPANYVPSEDWKLSGPGRGNSAGVPFLSRPYPELLAGN